jgi:hypothetical protein
MTRRASRFRDEHDTVSRVLVAIPPSLGGLGRHQATFEGRGGGFVSCQARGANGQHETE